jgi:hypothetical protein
MNQKNNMHNQKCIIFSIFSLFLIGSTAYSFAVQDNVTIEGNLNPINRSEELYVVYVDPSSEMREVIFSIYDSGEIIFSKTSHLNSGGTFQNFYIKFFPPLFKDNQIYAIEVKGPGLIGREVITIKEEFRSYSSDPLPVIPSNEDRKIEEQKRLEKQRELEEQKRLEKQRELEEQKRLEKQRELEEQTPLNSQISPKTQCGKGTVLENGVCTVVPIIPSNENNEEPPYSLIGIFIFVMMMIIPFVIKKSRKKKKNMIIQNYTQTRIKTKGVSPIWTEEKRAGLEQERDGKLEEKKREREKFLQKQKIRNDVERERVQQEKIEDKKKFLKRGLTKKTILATIDYCKENNIGSKSRLRRLKMKYEKWSLENQRDMEAARSDYNLLFDWIKEFENK